MKKMKKILALLLCLVLAVGAVTGTLAYLTDRDSEVNVFTVGDVKIDLTEDFDQGATLMPGEEIEKVPVITNTGKNDAWVWMTFAVPSALDNWNPVNDEGSYKNVIHWNPLGATAEGYVNATRVEKAIKDGYLPAGTTADSILANNQTWDVYNKLVNGGNAYQDEINGVDYNIYVIPYNKALEPGETTLPSVYKVSMDAMVDIDPDGNWAKIENGVATPINWNTNTNGAPLIYVSAYAIQKDGFESVDEAYAAYGKQWGDKGAEYGEVAVATPSPNAVRPAGYGNDAALLDEVNPVIDGVTVVDNSDENTNLRALYAGDGKKYKGNLTVNDSYLDGTYAMNAIGDDTGVLTVTDTDLRGWVSYDGFTAATFTDCTFGQNSNPEYYNNIRPYSAVTFTNCDFDGTTFWLDKLNGEKVTFVNCKMNGVLITDASQLTIEYGSTDSVVISNS